MQKGLELKYSKRKRWDNPNDMKPSNGKNTFLRGIKRKTKRLFVKELGD